MASFFPFALSAETKSVALEQQKQFSNISLENSRE